MEQLVARKFHKLEVVGSNPTSATIKTLNTMKQFVLFALIAIILVGCGKKERIFSSNPELVGIEDIIKMDDKQMKDGFGQDYKYYESYVIYDKFFDSGEDNKIVEMCSVFRVLDNEKESGSKDTRVIIFAHRPGSTFIDKKAGIFVENYNLCLDSIKVTFIQAYEKMMYSKLKKPRSKFCSLRRQYGEVKANPQYVFGNASEQIYVDAITGEVKNENPVFPGKKGPGWNE